MATLGIDFGSSYTTVSWINPRYGKPETVKFNGDGSVKYPSVIMGTSAGLVFGFQAVSYLEEVYKLPENERCEFMSNFIPSLKRILSPNGSEYIGNQSYTHAELLTKFFIQLKKEANKHCGSDVTFDSVVISHPVDFEYGNIKLLETSLHDAGFHNVTLRKEPISAVFGYSIDHDIPEDTGILVFDFGGGTLDVAFLKKHYGSLKLIGEPKGNKECGGQDFDALLYEDLRKRILLDYQFDITHNYTLDYGMLNCCRRLKEYFSGPNDSYETSVVFVHNNKIVSFKYRLSREAFNNIIYQKVYDAISLAKTVINQTQQHKNKIDKILLIGGSSQITLVRSMLSDILPDSVIDTCGEKDVAVALGNIVEELDSTVLPDSEIEETESEDDNVVEESPKQNPKTSGNVVYKHEDDGVLVFNW